MDAAGNVTNYKDQSFTTLDLTAPTTDVKTIEVDKYAANQAEISMSKTGIYVVKIANIAYKVVLK